MVTVSMELYRKPW